MKPVTPFVVFCAGLLLFCSGCINQAEKTECSSSNEPVSIGKLTGFYRQAQILGEWLKTGVGMEIIPDYYTELGDFPYLRKDTPKEVPFADRITVSRFMGGWGPGFGGIKNVEEAHSLDLVHRNADGSLVYNWGGQMDYLRNYLDAGVKEVVLSIDNIPWDLARDPKLSSYGQAQPQRDIKEWQTFFETFLDEMGKRYGADFMNTVSFRVGTEFNRTHTYTGNFDTYVEWYSHAAESVKKKFPGAKIGLCEICGWLEPGKDNINFVDVFDQLLKEKVPVDFIASSSHAFPVWEGNQLAGCADPRERSGKTVWLYNALLNDHPELRGKIPAYVFQFGVLRSEVRNDKGEYLISDEPGARGAAWNFIALMETWRQWPAIKGIGHWDVSTDVPGQPQMRLLKGNGWVYTVLDHLRGREVYALPVEGGETQNGSFCKSYAFVDPASSRQFLVVATFNTDRTVTNKMPVKITLPSSITGPTGSVAVRSCALTFESSPFSALREDLLNAGLLPDDYRANPYLIAKPQAYAGSNSELQRKMNDVFKANFNRYREMLKATLALKPCGGEIVSENGKILFKTELDVPSVSVFEFSK